MSADDCIRARALLLTAAMKQPQQLSKADGKLLVLLPGLGAVATTFVAGCMLARKGLAEPVGSLTQMGTIRLGKRTDNNAPKIKDFAPLAELGELEFAELGPVSGQRLRSSEHCQGARVAPSRRRQGRAQ